MPNIEIYSGGYCPYCLKAKTLLKQRGYTFTEYDVQANACKREEMSRRAPGTRTIPQIFINDRHVGGCDELYALDRAGKRAEWAVVA